MTDDLSFLDDDEFFGEGDDFLDEVIAEEASSDPYFVSGIADIAERQRVIRSLVELRRSSGVSQRRIAELMATTQSAVSEIEGGGTDVYLSTLQRYARAVGAPLSLHIQCRRGSTTPPRAPVVYLYDWSHADPALAGKHVFAKGA